MTNPEKRTTASETVAPELSNETQRQFFYDEASNYRIVGCSAPCFLIGVGDGKEYMMLSHTAVVPGIDKGAWSETTITRVASPELIGVCVHPKPDNLRGKLPSQQACSVYARAHGINLTPRE